MRLHVRQSRVQPCQCCHQPALCCAYARRLMRDYLECAPSSVVEDAVDTMCAIGGGVLKMVHTHDGAAAACMLVCYGSARDRKRLVKAMKGESAGF